TSSQTSCRPYSLRCATGSRTSRSWPRAQPRSSRTRRDRRCGPTAGWCSRSPLAQGSVSNACSRSSVSRTSPSRRTWPVGTGAPGAGGPTGCDRNGPWRPRPRYARSGDVHLAYQVVGDGPRDVVLALNWASHLEVLWEQPFVQELVSSLARFARVLWFY